MDESATIQVNTPPYSIPVLARFKYKTGRFKPSALENTVFSTASAVIIAAKNGTAPIIYYLQVNHVYSQIARVLALFRPILA